MNSWARKSFKVGVLSAGALLFAGTAANAATLTSVGNNGIGSGLQLNSIVQAPIDVCGNAVGVIGGASAGCVGGSWANLGDDNTVLNSFGNNGILSGAQVNSVIQAPIDVCGNAVGVIGGAWAQCVGGSAANLGGGNGGSWSGANAHQNMVKPKHKKNTTESAHVTESTSLTSVGNNGIGSGAQVNSAIQIPIDVCGNAVGVLGGASASCKGGASATDSSGGNVEAFSGFNTGILSGAQVNSILQVPIDVCGNAIGVIGGASASCEGGSSATIGGGNGGGWTGGGNGGYGYGGGNGGYGYGGGQPGASSNENVAAGKSAHFHHVLAKPSGYQGGGQPGGNWGGGACSPTLTSVGNNGILSGAQINSVIQAPVEISGNAIGILGGASASSQGGAWASC